MANTRQSAPFSRIGLFQFTPLSLPRWAVRAALDTLDGTGMDRLAAASLLDRGLASVRYVAQLVPFDRLVRWLGRGSLFTGLSLSAYVEYGAATANDLGGIWD